ncbi:hypothetical protein ACYSNU_07245 [Enterococcus sp. LJL120]
MDFLTNNLLHELKVNLYEAYTEIFGPNDLTIFITKPVAADAKNMGFSFQSEHDSGFLFFLNAGKVVALATTNAFEDPDVPFDQLIYLDFPLETEKDYYSTYLNNVLHTAGQPYAAKLKKTALPENIEKIIIPAFADSFLILERFGYPLTRPQAAEEKPSKAKGGKPRHKWTKEVSEIEFSVDRPDAQAKVFWIKRNEMLIKAGAKMLPQAPLNKDGSLGFSARFGEQLRQEHQHQFKDFTTTEDIILKSVSEVGLFLYFGGTNSWLELLDKNGKSINEWTVVN